MGSVDLPGGYCGLRACPDRNCTTTPSAPGPNNRTSGWIVGRTLPASQPEAAIALPGYGSALHNFSLVVKTAFAHLPAVWIQPNASSNVVAGLNITLLQSNVSNAVKVEGMQFEITGNIMNQVGSCEWPGYGPDSDRTPFQPSTTVYMHNARAGLLAGNTIYWRCSAFDLDVSDRMAFENNTISCTEHGVVPHGNSISGYDWHAHPIWVG